MYIGRATSLLLSGAAITGCIAGTAHAQTATPAGTTLSNTAQVSSTVNGTQDFWLDPDQTTLSVGIITGSDKFDLTGMKADVDSNNNAVHDPGVETQEYLDGLEPDALRRALWT